MLTGNQTEKRWKKSWDNLESPLVQNYDYWHDIYIPKRKEMMDMFLLMPEVYQPKATSVLDIGAGTGSISLNLIKKYPKLFPTLIDGSDPQLKTARKRFQSENISANFFKKDLNSKSWFQNFPKNLPLIVSNLMIHHLADIRKKELFSEIYSLLNKNGLFLYGDVIKFDKKETEDNALDLWTHDIRKNFIAKGLELNDFSFMKNKLIENCDKEGDMPATINYILSSLSEAGFRKIQLVWFYLKFAVFVAVK